MDISARRDRWWNLAPTLAGATTRGRILACVGAFIGICTTGLFAAFVHGQGAALPWLITTMGSSAMLLFLLPASPMAQPWPIVAGNTLSAFVGFALGRWLGHDAFVCGFAVALAIAVMSLTRSLHPPAASAALTGVIGGSLVDSAGWWFPIAPVALNAAILVVVGWLFHRTLGHSYPHRRHPTGPTDDSLVTSDYVGVSDKDLDAVLDRLGETYDISRDDLRLIVGELELRVLTHQD
jgi:CBS domain-containing membrane protein